MEDWKIFNLIIKKLGDKNNLSNFDQLRKEALNTIPNFSKINELPNRSETENKKILTNFESEVILINELDYFYSNSISRSSKIMSECRKINQKIKKDGTNN